MLVQTVTLIGLYAAFAPLLGRGRAAALPRPLARLLPVLAGLGAAAALYHFGSWWATYFAAHVPVEDNDFAIFYGASHAAIRRLPLYDLANVRLETSEINTYRYAPIGAALFAPLLGLDLRGALVAWQLGSIALYVATLGALLWHFRAHLPWSPRFGLVAVWFAFAPTYQSLANGQLDTLFLAGSALALLLLARRRDGWAGLALALPVVLKVYPALLLLPPLTRGRWRVPLACAIAVGGLVLAGALFAGGANTAIFFGQVLPTTGGGTIYAANQTPYAFVGRLLASILVGTGRYVRYPVEATTLIARALALLVLAISLLTIWLRGRGEAVAEVAFALLIPATLLLIPTAWVHYEEWALLALVVLTVALARSARPARWAWPLAACFAVALLLLTLGTEEDVWTEGVHVGAVRLILTYKLYGLVALWVGLLLILWRDGVPQTAAQAAPQSGDPTGPIAPPTGPPR